MASEVECAHLSREQKTAMACCLHYIDKLSSLFHYETLLKKNEPLLPSNFVAASLSAFEKSDLPREKHWIWNQSNAKVSVKFAEATVIFRKISPKKKVGVLKAPSFKIWIFQIEFTHLPEHHFLWCEKGVIGSASDMISQSPLVSWQKQISCRGVSTEIGTIFPHQLSTQSFSFLLPYVDEKTALELGWM